MTEAFDFFILICDFFEVTAETLGHELINCDPGQANYLTLWASIFSTVKDKYLLFLLPCTIVKIKREIG